MNRRVSPRATFSRKIIHELLKNNEKQKLLNDGHFQQYAKNRIIVYHYYVTMIPKYEWTIDNRVL